MSNIPEGFTPWGGGDCPAAAKGRKTEVIFRDGSQETLDGESFRWTHYTPAQDWHDFDIIAYRVEQPEAKAGAGNVLDKLLATVPMPDLPTTLRSIADRVTVAANNPSHYGGHRGALDFVKREVGMLRIAADRVHDVISAQPKPAEGGAVAPDGYAYVYPAQSLREPAATVIRFETGGREINGSKPIESIPYYLGKPAPAAATRAEEVEALVENADRYLWLRDEARAEEQAKSGEWFQVTMEYGNGHTSLFGEALDTAIDEARRLAGKEE